MTLFEKSYHCAVNTISVVIMIFIVLVIINRALVAQLVECGAVMRKVVSSTPAGPLLRVVK